MSKEYEKFKAEAKKLDSDYKSVTLDAANSLSERVKQDCGNLGIGGVDNLRSAIEKARKAGVVGDKYADFAGNHVVDDAVKQLKAGVKLLEDTLSEVPALSTRATAANTAYTKLSKSIDKDLAGRKDKSESKKEIVALQKQVDDRVTDLDAAIKRLGKIKPTASTAGFLTAFPRELAAVFAENAATNADYIAAQDVPEKFRDRVLKKYLSQCTTAFHNIKSAVDDATAKITAGDRPGAGAELKKALEARKDLTAVSDEYATNFKKHNDELKKNKDAKKVADAVQRMVDLDKAADKLIRTAAASFQKAA